MIIILRIGFQPARNVLKEANKHEYKRGQDILGSRRCKEVKKWFYTIYSADSFYSVVFCSILFYSILFLIMI